MDGKDRQKLRQYLEIEVKKYREERDNDVITTAEWLDEDSGQFYFTEAEMAVFRFDDQYCIPLIVAFWAYEDLIELVRPAHFSGELLILIEEARDACPPARYFDYEKTFEKCADCAFWFAWFAKEFLDIPHRQSMAYHTKRDFNTANLITYMDEK